MHTPPPTTNSSNRDRRKPSSSGGGGSMKDSPGPGKGLEFQYSAGLLSDVSKQGVGKYLERVQSRSLKRRTEKLAWPDEGDGKGSTSDSMGIEGVNKNSLDSGNGANELPDVTPVEETDNTIWEDGSIPDSSFSDRDANADSVNKGVEINISWSEESSKKRPARRVSAEEKEIAENVHKVNLLCLLARGRLVDKACDDSLIQAALLVLLPETLHKITEQTHVTKNCLAPIVVWFNKHFRICGQGKEKRPFSASLASALQAGEGTPEEIAALSVALFRALRITTRFVSVLDVSSLKPEAEKPETQRQSVNGIFKSPTPMIGRPDGVIVTPATSLSMTKRRKLGVSVTETLVRAKSGNTSAYAYRSGEGPSTEQLSDGMLNDFEPSTNMGASSSRKGDLEFEMQMQMALSATARATNAGSNVKILDRLIYTTDEKFNAGTGESVLSSSGISTAFGSRNVGATLYWAEVFCTGESPTGRWVHVDAANSIIDGEHNVEALSAACKISLRYVVAFAGLGVKDVTRRYCQKWYQIASKRIDSVWWDNILAPLNKLESRATEAVVDLEHGKLCDPLIKSFQSMSENHGKQQDLKPTFLATTRSSLEDLDLVTKSLTEPLPTNQQAYKNHQLYAIERWLSKFQILHPKGPVIGFVSGHPVYPRSCVQTLKTKEKWLREALQLKPEELPVKVLKHSKGSNSHASEDDLSDNSDVNGTIQLYGVWQTEPLCLPPAVNGKVPRNERGQVDVWSKKCLPPGTVHLRMLRIVPIVKKLGIDFAPAMVGFEFKGGRSLPVYNGVVVCSEFKSSIMEAYREEEERKEAEEKRRGEAQAISRWYQLLSSILTRQRLDHCYANGNSLETSNDGLKRSSNSLSHHDTEMGAEDPKPKHTRNSKAKVPSGMSETDHEHVFLREDETFDKKSSVRTKQCKCGFSVQVEEM